MFKSLAAAAVLLTLSVPAFAQTAASKLVGTYDVTGTDVDGTPYNGGSVVTVTAEPSGALGIKWDSGEYIGVGQVTGDTLAIAAVDTGKNSIMLLKIAADGSLSGPYWRRTDPGTKGTETWKKK